MLSFLIRRRPAPTLARVESYRGTKSGWMQCGSTRPMDDAVRLMEYFSRIHPNYKWRVKVL